MQIRAILYNWTPADRQEVFFLIINSSKRAETTSI